MPKTADPTPTDERLAELVAERVLGWERIPGRTVRQWDDGTNHLLTPNISDWDTIGMIVAAMLNRQMPNHAGPTMLHCLKSCALGKWSCQWCSDFGYTEPVIAETPGRAVALAALLAVGVTREEIEGE